MKVLLKNNIKAEAIHGNKAQNARQRALANFKAQTTRVLVATDIASRGIDVEDMENVINFEIPNIPETYVHRIGRTGRAGASGTAYSFCEAEEKEYLRDIEKLIGKKIPVMNDHPFPLKDHHPVKAPKQPAQGQHRSSTNRQRNSSPRNHGSGQASSRSHGASTSSSRSDSTASRQHGSSSGSKRTHRPNHSPSKGHSSTSSHDGTSSASKSQKPPEPAPKKKSWFSRFRK